MKKFKKLLIFEVTRFEKVLGEILLELLMESAKDENRNSDTKEFITE